jgi:esterase/lipase
LAKLGYISFLFDMQGHGESEGDINTATTKEFLDDVLAAYDYFMKVEGVDTENVGVVGSSFGGYLGILLSEKRNVKRLALRVPADYPNDAFDKSKMVTSGGDNPVVIAWRAKPKDVHGTYALDALSKFTGDMLIIESEKDIVVPHQSIQNYINVIPDRDRLTHVVMKNAPHSAPAGPFRNIVEHTLVDWFRKWV